MKIFIPIILVLIFSCTHNKPKWEGNWTFIELNGGEFVDYAEIYISDDYNCSILSEQNGRISPYIFEIKSNKVIFNETELEVLFFENKRELVYDSTRILLFRIPFNLENLKKDLVDPFYLRRCYFLNQLNLIDTKEVQEYLCNQDTF